MSIEVGGTFGISFVWRDKTERWHADCMGAKKKTGFFSNVLGYDWLWMEVTISCVGSRDRRREAESRE
jgi:hypothetical protein